MYCLYGSNNMYYSTLTLSICALVTCILLVCFRSRFSRVKLTFPAYVIILAAILIVLVMGERLEIVYHLMAGVLGVATVVFYTQTQGTYEL